jgi:transcriptional regulator with XRE-family HTH domain
VVRDERDLATMGSRLSDRLRSLREDRGLTQRQLGTVLGGEGTMVSMWETSKRVPPEDRLRVYARLFAINRSFSGQASPQLIDDDDLTEEERRSLEVLERELLSLRDEAQRSEDEPIPSARVFRFSDTAPVTVVCADVPEEERPPYAARTDLNYVRASSFADLDALLDLYGHLRAENPDKDVRIRAAGDLKQEELRGHLVLLGGSVFNEATRWLSDQLSLPVKDSVNGEEAFVVEQGHERHKFTMTRQGQMLLEDVGVFARAPNPQAPDYTITICNGITTRGVRGAVLCFSDRNLRSRNEQYVARRFAGSSSFGVVLRVTVLPMSGESLAPDLRKADTRLFEWADGEPGPG